MKRSIILLLAFTASLGAATFGIERKIEAEGVIVTRAELARYLAEGGALQAATSQELAAASKHEMPYLVLRFRSPTGGHIWGEVDAVINDGRKVRQRIVLHRAKDWVEYFIPQSNSWHAMSAAIPKISFEWDWLREK